MVEVVAFSASPYASCQRPKRSLDPLLGETYELVHPEKGFRMVSEHVRTPTSHTLPKNLLHVCMHGFVRCVHVKIA